MFGHLSDPSPPRPGPEDRAAVSRRAQGIVRRRRTVAGVAAAAAIAVAAMIPAVLASGSGADRHIRAADGGPSTSSPIDETTTTAPGQDTTTSVASSPTSLSRSATPTATTTTALVCRNSTDSRCGPFRWDPAPAPDQPLTAHVTFAPASPRPGEVVHFYPVADDPDAAFIYSITCPGAFGDDANPPPCPVSSSIPVPPNQPTAYGPWTPPPPEHGHCPGGDPHVECQFFFPTNSSRDGAGTCSIDHTYNAPGTYPVKLLFKSFVRPTGIRGLPDPYGDTVTASVTVTVSGSPVTTTTAPGPTASKSDC